MVTKLSHTVGTFVGVLLEVGFAEALTVKFACAPASEETVMRTGFADVTEIPGGNVDVPHRRLVPLLGQ